MLGIGRQGQPFEDPPPGPQGPDGAVISQLRVAPGGLRASCGTSQPCARRCERSQQPSTCPTRTTLNDQVKKNQALPDNARLLPALPSYWCAFYAFVVNACKQMMTAGLLLQI